MLPTVNLNLLANLDAHQILAHFERTRIRFSHLRSQVGSHRRDNVRIYSQLGVYPRENGSSLFRRGVMCDYVSHLFRSKICRPAKRFGINHFVNQHVSSLSEANEIFRVSRISREHHGVPCKVDSITRRRFDGSVIDEERCYLDSVLFINDDTSGNIPRFEPNALPR